MSFLSNFFGNAGGDSIAKYETVVKQINELEAKFELFRLKN